uniref:Uncharacterized protein n=1 Tax=Dromaius novaehollandiae TaxID=8790 RepID=A0A8C4J7S7_DRONO
MCGASEPFGAGLNSNGGASAASSRRSGVPGPAAAEAWRRMESEPSRIPVYGALHRGGPAEMQMVFPSKKQCVSKAADLEFSKDPNFNFSSSIPGDGVFKATNQGFPKSAKKTEPVSKKTAARGPLSRYKLEAELKTKNQLLETAKQQLHSRLAGAQVRSKTLIEQSLYFALYRVRSKDYLAHCPVSIRSQ